VTGLVQVVAAASSTEHWNVDGLFDDANANCADVSFVSTAGVETSDVSGAVWVWYTKVALPVPVLPAASVQVPLTTALVESGPE
jgi:hypothetical protein